MNLVYHLPSLCQNGSDARYFFLCKVGIRVCWRSGIKHIVNEARNDSK